MLSPKKKKFVEFIKHFACENSRPPTFVEIMNGLNYSSLGTVNWYIVELEKEGIIERVKGFNGKRALSLIEQNINNELPLLGVVSAGIPIDPYDFEEKISVPALLFDKNRFVLKVDGDSMIDDGILNGDYVIIEKSNVAVEGETIIASINGETTMKRYYIGSNGIELHPRNNKHDIIYIGNNDELVMQGLVKGIFRKY